MNLTETLSTSSGARWLAIDDPSSLGFDVQGLPATWRRTRADAADGTPAASWMNRAEFSIGTADADGPTFASVALLMAWRLSGWERSPIETVGLLSAMTEEITGWSSRGSENGRLDSTHASVRLLGTLDSPYGPLICNAHNIVYVAGPDELIAVQLSVTANPGDDVDGIRLCEGAAT